MPQPSSYQRPVSPNGDGYKGVAEEWNSVSDVENEGNAGNGVMHDPKARFQYENPSEQWRDAPWALAFLAHLVVFLGASLVYGRQFVLEGGFSKPYEEASTSATHINNIAAFLVVAAVTGAVLAFLYLELMRRHMENIMTVSFYFFIGTLGAYGCFALYNMKSVFLSLLTAVGCVLSIIYFFIVRNRLPLARAILLASCSALETHSAPLYIAYGLAAVQVVWFLFWGLSAVFILSGLGLLSVGAVDPDLHSTGTHHTMTLFLLFLSLYWTSQVIKNIGHTTTAGTVASWWLIPSFMAGSVASGALRRACTTSLGSICLGSFIVAFLQTLRQMLRLFTKDEDPTFVQFCINCLLECIERMVRYFNHYAYTFVAIYGDSFSEASAKTSQLFETRGFTLLVNDDLTGLPLFFGGVSVGALCSLGSVVWSSFYMGHEKTVLIGYALTAFVIGILMASIAFGVITSAVSTTFVVWAESPQEMSLQQPQSFKLISEARRSYYGNN